MWGQVVPGLLTHCVPERFPRLCQSVFHARPFLLCVLSLEGALEIGF